MSGINARPSLGALTVAAVMIGLAGAALAWVPDSWWRHVWPRRGFDPPVTLSRRHPPGSCDDHNLGDVTKFRKGGFSSRLANRLLERVCGIQFTLLGDAPKPQFRVTKSCHKRVTMSPGRDEPSGRKCRFAGVFHFRAARVAILAEPHGQAVSRGAARVQGADRAGQDRAVRGARGAARVQG